MAIPIGTECLDQMALLTDILKKKGFGIFS